MLAAALAVAVCALAWRLPQAPFAEPSGRESPARSQPRPGDASRRWLLLAGGAVGATLPAAYMASATDGAAGLNTAGAGIIAVEVLDVLNLYGRLAGSGCFGRTAPAGLSCQLGMEDFDRVVFRGAAAVDEGSFTAALRATAPRWPLRPAVPPQQTALASRLAELRVLKDAAFNRFSTPGYNPSDRELPVAVATALASEELPMAAVHLVFVRLAGSGRSSAELPRGAGLTREGVASMLASLEGRALDWYSFLDLLGRQWVTWPAQAVDR